MSKVIRLDDEMMSDLNVFTSLYLGELEKHSNESALCSTLLNDHLNYTLTNQVGFAIRYAANNLRIELNRNSDNS